VTAGTASKQRLEARGVLVVNTLTRDGHRELPLGSLELPHLLASRVTALRLVIGPGYGLPFGMVDQLIDALQAGIAVQIEGEDAAELDVVLTELAARRGPR
jgi:hypothetical protein